MNSKILFSGCLALLINCLTIASALDADSANESLKALCQSMDGMPGCHLKKLCDADPAALGEPYCHPISLVASICRDDMPRMKDCASYNNECRSNQTCQNLYPAPASLPTSAQLASNIYDICNEMTMDGCDRCKLRPGARYANCDLLEVYSNLCAAMPGMLQCGAWKAFCSSAPGTSTSLCNDGSDPSTQIPSMIMYFHTGLVENILFKSWVPRTMWQYWLSILALFLLSIVFEVFQALHIILDMHLAKSSKPIKSKCTTPQEQTSSSDDVSPTYSTAPLTSSAQNHTTSAHFGTFPLLPSAHQNSTSFWFKLKSSLLEKRNTNWNHAMLKGFLRMIHATLAYALMLVAMTYNVGLFFAVILGLGIGHMLVTPLVQSAEKAMTPGSDWELCC